MTLTTRTTRKAPWAAALTALLAVLGMVFGLLAVMSPAAADDIGSGEGGNPDVVCAGYMFKADGLSGSSYTIQSQTAGGITDWCLKAGQTREYGNGAYAETVTVTASGKYAISHVAWNEATPPPTPGKLCKISTLTVVDYANTAVAPYTTDVLDPDFTTDLGQCTPPEETTVVEEATVVAPVLPGTVEEPETVAVPAPATIPMPATIPAGDGSGTPTVPTALLALLALGATALAASTVRLVRTTR